MNQKIDKSDRVRRTRSRRTTLAFHPQVRSEFLSSLESLFPGVKTKFINENDAKDLWEREKPGEHKLVRKSDCGMRMCLFLCEPLKKEMVFGVELDFDRAISAVEWRLGSQYARVFNADLGVAKDFDSRELWKTLQKTRFARVIARRSQFSTEPLTSWLMALESATNLTYEGKPFSMHIVLCWNPKHVSEGASENFVSFDPPIRRDSALFSEKWVRALAHSGEIALVGHARMGVIGTVAIGSYDAVSSDKPFIHESLAYLVSLLRNGVALLTVTKAGDIFLQSSDGSIFVRRQGRWRYLNTRLLVERIATFMNYEVAVYIANMVLSLSYERKGALIGIVDKVDLSKIVPDSDTRERSNHALREMVKSLDVTEPAHRKILRSVAMVDGAVLYSMEGEVLDATCMIAYPSQSINNHGKDDLPSLPGARSTAARNCSVYGLAIKVSDDGPVTVFENGRVTLELG